MNEKIIEMQEEKNEHVVRLIKPYVFEGTEYTEINLSKIENLKIKDAVDAQKELFGQGEVATAMLTETTSAFARQIAVKGSDYPEEFFKFMPRGTFKQVVAAVREIINVSVKEGTHVMKFETPYSFEKKTYKEVDLSGIGDLTAMNESEAENAMAREGFMITETSLNYYYPCVLASMATGQPITFFTGLPICETLKLKAMVNDPNFFE